MARAAIPSSEAFRNAVNAVGAKWCGMPLQIAGFCVFFGYTEGNDRLTPAELAATCTCIPGSRPTAGTSPCAAPGSASRTPSPSASTACAGRGGWTSSRSPTTTRSRVRCGSPHLPSTFLSVEVTTRFPEDDMPLHVLVWNLSEEDHRDLQPSAASVYELVDVPPRAAARHALAHPLYRMGPPITAVARRAADAPLRRLGRAATAPARGSTNELACRLAAAARRVARRSSPSATSSSRCTPGRSRSSGGLGRPRRARHRDDLDRGTGDRVEAFLDARGRRRGRAGRRPRLDGQARPRRRRALPPTPTASRRGRLPPLLDIQLRAVRREPRTRPSATRRSTAAEPRSSSACWASARASGGLGLDAFTRARPSPCRGPRSRGGARRRPTLATHHHADARADLAAIEKAFFGSPRAHQPRARRLHRHLRETNGVAGTMRRLSAAGCARPAEGDRRARRARARTTCRARRAADGMVDPAAGLGARSSSGSRACSTSLAAARGRRARPHPRRHPGPGRVARPDRAEAPGIPVIGSYHTELGSLRPAADARPARRRGTGATSTGSTASCDLVLATDGGRR